MGKHGAWKRARRVRGQARWTRASATGLAWRPEGRGVIMKRIREGVGVDRADVVQEAKCGAKCVTSSQ